VSRHDPALIKSFEDNRAAIARATNPVFAIRQEKREAIKAVAERYAAEAKAEGRRLDYDGFVRETSAIESEYLAREMAL